MHTFIIQNLSGTFRAKVMANNGAEARAMAWKLGAHPRSHIYATMVQGRSKVNRHE